MAECAVLLISSAQPSKMTPATMVNTVSGAPTLK
jgi:hypothetical protein